MWNSCNFDLYARIEIVLLTTITTSTTKIIMVHFYCTYPVLGDIQCETTSLYVAYCMSLKTMIHTHTHTHTHTHARTHALTHPRTHTHTHAHTHTHTHTHTHHPHNSNNNKT